MTKHASLSRYAQVGAFLLRYRKAGLFDGLDLDVHESTLAEQAEDVPQGQPEQFADDLEALGNTFIKIGQALSTRPDMVPPACMNALERMQDNVAPVPVGEVRSLIEAELGARIPVLFGSFDNGPLAAGSVAQVHAATLRDGREVVVKVQRPHIAEILREDLAIPEELAAQHNG